MKICIDCDDAAINLKKVLIDHLKSKGIDITDLNYSASNVGAMYPEIGFNLAKEILQCVKTSEYAFPSAPHWPTD